MVDMEIRQAVSPREAKSFDTDQLRRAFLVEDIFAPNDIRLTYTYYDRLVLGGAMPVDREVFMPVTRATGTENFLDRREMVVINIGGEGQVVTLNGTYMLARRDALYLGRGVGPVTFSSTDRQRPARFFLASAPAHRAYPARLVSSADAKRVDQGDPASSNARATFNFVHPEIMETCQISAGITILAEGSTWSSIVGRQNRSSAACLYFGMRPENRILHVMGAADETRHLVVANEQAVLSPPWSVQMAVGAQAYALVWVTAGDNVDEKDVDIVSLDTIR